MTNKKKFTVDDFKRAIEGGYEDETGGKVSSSGGIISTIAARLGCDWHTVPIYIKENSEIGQIFSDELEKTKDAMESVVVKSGLSGDTADAKWWLAKKAKDRGYADVVENEHYGKVIIEVVRSDGNAESSSSLANSAPKTTRNKKQQGKKKNSKGR